MKQQKSSHRTKPKRPTLVDVAREAGVGTTTVSRVINGGHYVDAGTLARVQAVIGHLGYSPSHAARALKGEKTHSIGFIVPTLLDPFFARFASVVQGIARQMNYVLIVLASEDEAQQETLELETFRSYRVDGLLIVPPRQQSRKFLSALSALSVPTIAVDRPLAGRFSSVTCNNFEASQEAVEHLLGHGRRRILCFGGDPDLKTIQERVRGYEVAMRATSLEPCLALGAAPEQMAANLQRHFHSPDERPDAIFALYGDASVAAYEFLIDSPYALATDVALLGFDDFRLAATLRPPVSVVRQPVDELAKIAAHLLFEQIETGSQTPRQVTIATDLILRASCGCCPSGGHP